MRRKPHPVVGTLNILVQLKNAGLDHCSHCTRKFKEGDSIYPNPNGTRRYHPKCAQLKGIPTEFQDHALILDNHPFVITPTILKILQGRQHEKCGLCQIKFEVADAVHPAQKEMKTFHFGCKKEIKELIAGEPRKIRVYKYTQKITI